ncbi:hypothetical protein HR51_27990 [Burkholderia cepacia]|nr:hypothetical protein HR51_27990 [Burkholderia cepacia]
MRSRSGARFAKALRRTPFWHAMKEASRPMHRECRDASVVRIGNAPAAAEAAPCAQIHPAAAAVWRPLPMRLTAA